MLWWQRMQNVVVVVVIAVQDRKSVYRVCVKTALLRIYSYMYLPHSYPITINCATVIYNEVKSCQQRLTIFILQ